MQHCTAELLHGHLSFFLLHAAAWADKHLRYIFCHYNMPTIFLGWCILNHGGCVRAQVSVVIHKSFSFHPLENGKGEMKRWKRQAQHNAKYIPQRY